MAREPKAPLQVQKQVSLSADCDRAFTLFTENIGEWWPLATHSVSAGICQAPSARLSLEPHVGGALIEVRADGGQEIWGHITRWDPPHGLSFSWHPGMPPDEATHVRIDFVSNSGPGCTLHLHHTGWEIRGASADEARQSYDGGWDTVLEAGFQTCLLKDVATQ